MLLDLLDLSEQVLLRMNIIDIGIHILISKVIYPFYIENK
jgi:hypothetical protein